MNAAYEPILLAWSAFLAVFSLGVTARIALVTFFRWRRRRLGKTVVVRVLPENVIPIARARSARDRGQVYRSRRRRA